MPLPQFKWIGTASDTSGHADELRGFLRAQEQAGHEPALQELRWTDKDAGLSHAEQEMLRRQTSRSNRHIDIAVHTYLPWEQNPTFHGAVNIARAMFETDRLPEPWLAPVLRRDELWVPCRNNFEAFADSGIPERKMRIVGGTINFDLFSPGVDPYPLEVEPGRFVFLTNFDFSERKGWQTLLAAWGQAFTADDPVALVLKTGSFYREEGYVEGRIQTMLQQRFGPALSKLAPVYMLTDLLDTADMPRLYAAADAYVLASRGEGWGRPYMEAQAMGLPTIASRWGGQREFMDADTSWLVDGDLIDVPNDAELFNTLYQGHRWFDPDVDDLAAKMREIAADWDAAARRAEPARQRLIEQVRARRHCDHAARGGGGSPGPICQPLAAVVCDPWLVRVLGVACDRQRRTRRRPRGSRRHGAPPRAGRRAGSKPRPRDRPLLASRLQPGDAGTDRDGDPLGVRSAARRMGAQCARRCRSCVGPERVRPRAVRRRGPACRNRRGRPQRL